MDQTFAGAIFATLTRIKAQRKFPPWSSSSIFGRRPLRRRFRRRGHAGGGM